MNMAMMNHTDGLVELTVQELVAVAGGIGDQPPLPKLTLETNLEDIGEEPPRPKLPLETNLATIGADPPPPTR